MRLRMPHGERMTDTLIVLAHHDTSFHAALAEAYAEGARTAGRVQLLRVPELVFDPVLRAGFAGEQELEPDLLRFRAAIEAADHVAWVFPTWWAGPPAGLKALIDRTFLPGWAFRYGRGPLPTGLLAGRSSRVLLGMDSPRWWYRFAHGRAVHRAFGTATLRFVGFAPVRFTTFHSLRTSTERRRARHLERARRLGERDARRAPARPLSALGAGTSP